MEVADMAAEKELNICQTKIIKLLTKEMTIENEAGGNSKANKEKASLDDDIKKDKKWANHYGRIHIP